MNNLLDKEPVQRVEKILAQFDQSIKIQILDKTARTAEDAAESLKTEVGSMISMATGKALGFSLANLQERGALYIGPGTEVYEGMVVGNTVKGADMEVNPTKGKQLTNVRASGSDDAIKLTPPVELTLEMAMGLMREDEYLEVTPNAIRLRKQYLKESDRARNKRQAKK